MSDRDTAMVNFRLNLSKKGDREIYDYLCKFDSPDFKTVLKGGKSNFIKTILLSFIRKEKQEKEATKALAEQKAQNEELAEIFGAKLDESQRALLQALPELVEKVVLGALESKVVIDDTAIKGVIASSNTVAENSNDVEGSTKAGDDTGVLPQVSEELPDEAFDYFSGFDNLFDFIMTNKQIEGVIKLFALNFVRCESAEERKNIFVQFEDTFSKEIVDWEIKCKEMIGHFTADELLLKEFDKFNCDNKYCVDEVVKIREFLMKQSL